MHNSPNIGGKMLDSCYLSESDVVVRQDTDSTFIREYPVIAIQISIINNTGGEINPLDPVGK